MIDLSTIRNTDPEVCRAMEQELSRQRGNLELIASENIVSPAVMAAMGSHLTNKYAEGYPGKRYYGGCEFVISLRILPATGSKRSSAASMPTSSRTAAPRRILPSISPCSNRAIPSWA